MTKLHPMDLTVKHMELKDLEAVHKLCLELGYSIPLPELRARFLKLQKLNYHAFFVIGTGVQGFIHLEKVTGLIEKERVQIRALVINEKSRGRGLGQKLIHKSIEWTQEQDLQKIFLSCNIIRDRAHAFYLKEGFIKTKTSHFFELNI